MNTLTEIMIPRQLATKINQKFGKGKAIIIVGPRQVGKTTLCKSTLENKNYLFLDGDDPTVRNILTNPNTEQIKSILAANKIVFIDEAQRIGVVTFTRTLNLRPFVTKQIS